MSNRAREYRMLIEDVIAGGLLEPEEIAAIRALIAKAMRAAEAKEAAE